MRKSRFMDSRIALILRQAEEGTSVEELCRKAGISAQTHCRWRQASWSTLPGRQHA